MNGAKDTLAAVKRRIAVLKRKIRQEQQLKKLLRQEQLLKDRLKGGW